MKAPHVTAKSTFARVVGAEQRKSIEEKVLVRRTSLIAAHHVPFRL